ncbi:MAG: hypothetical protein Q9199_005361 [Rusavskia elegans]
MADDGVDHLTPIPPEIKKMIVGYVGTDGPRFPHNAGRETLRDLRFFRIFNDAATRLLFSKLIFRAHMKPVDFMKRQKFTFGHYVKTLFVTTIEYEYEDWDLAGFCAMIDCSDHPLLDDLDHHKQAFDIYTQLRNDHLDSLAAKDCLAHLTSLLSSMPKLQKVVLTGDQRAIGNYKEVYTKDYCKCKLRSCSEPSEDHWVLANGPRAGLRELGKEHFLMLMSALSTTTAPVTELEVASGDEANALNYRVLNLSPARMIHTVDVLSCLTKLSLEFFADEVEPMDLATLDGSTTESSPIARILSHADDLEHLELHIETEHGSKQKGDFKTIMLGCLLPSLKTCLLQDWNVEAEDLLNFLHGSPHLTELCLARCNFTVGTLDSVLDVLRRSKPYLSVEVV